ncbi:hypothetical protein QBC40DRAFT_162703 [Triangularia verruculosa]|uniref:Uncharacterized protein n=1 Tax=Triangularia verruculosa TaxID=2587418 RepID=A0AAN6XRC7_9PEZI|nr:hypothetical protein QBC40DRAFT_162703 [Triangularia verruculosa]
MPPGRFPHTTASPARRGRRRRAVFPLPAFYVILLLCVIAWTASHTTASWDYTTYNHKHDHHDPKRHHARDTYTPFPGRVVPQHVHHHEKRNGMAGGMAFLEMLGRAQGGGVAVTRPLGGGASVRGHRGRYGNGGRGGEGKGRKGYDVVRLDDAVGEPVGYLTEGGEGEGELKRGRMVVVEGL